MPPYACLSTRNAISCSRSDNNGKTPTLCVPRAVNECLITPEEIKSIISFGKGGLFNEVEIPHLALLSLCTDLHRNISQRSIQLTYNLVLPL